MLTVAAAMSSGDKRTAFAVPAYLCGMLAFGLLATWVQTRAETGGPALRFLEQLRRALAYEEPLPPR